MAWSITDSEIAPDSPITTSLMTRLRNGGIETGTRLVGFHQAAAPLGWTKVTSGVDNRALRVFSGTPSDAGSVDFSTVFGLTATDPHTLTESQIPAHDHPAGELTANNHTHGAGSYKAASHDHDITVSADPGSSANTVPRGLSSGADADEPIQNSGELDVSGTSSGSGAVTVSGTTGDAGGGNPHSHNIDLRVRYLGVILCTKD